MKKIFFVLLVAVISVSSFASADYTYTLSFNEADFNISSSSGDSVYISCSKYPSTYLEINQPCIPILSQKIAIPSNGIIKSFTVEFNKRLIKKNVNLANSPIQVPTSSTSTFQNNFGYDPKIYPDSNCIRTKSIFIGGIEVTNFLVSPFIYDATSHNLYFIDSMELKFEFERTNMRKAPSTLTTQQKEILDGLVVNRDSLIGIPITPLQPKPEDLLDYVIITSEKLKGAFQPLAAWKKKKGVPSKIVTIEEIEQNYSEPTQQMRIKSCIKKLVSEHGTQYVLLGGDIDIVPTQPCYVDYRSFWERNDTASIYEAWDIPADVYYSALQDLDWDTNGDGKVGDLKLDNIDFTPSLPVTRIPVRTESETSAFVNRIIEYEQNPSFKRELFQSGAWFTNYFSGEEMADSLFKQVIVNHIPMGATKLFGRPLTSNSPLTLQSFSEKLSQGFMAVEVFSHGLETSMDGWDHSVFFNSSKASTFENTGHSIFTTVACLTNAFDKPETDNHPNPCISEALIRNPNSGIIAYLGSSRFGWRNSAENGYGASFAFENSFYKRLLRAEQKPMNTHFGLLTMFVKLDCCGLAQTEPNYRWLHYSLNPIGDPETILYGGIPMSIDASAEYNDEGKLVVITDVENPRVCVSSRNGSSYYEIKEGNNCVFDTGNGYFDVWITNVNYKSKISYKPTHFEVEKPLVRDTDSTFFELDPVQLPVIVSIYPNPTTGIVNINYSTTTKNSTVLLSLIPVSGGNNYLFNLPNDRTQTTLDLSIYPKGIYIVKIIENGKYNSESPRLILQ